MAPTPLTDRTLTVLAHLLHQPYADHTINTTVRGTGMPYHHVDSAMALLAAQGWVVRRHTAGREQPYTLTSIGRVEGAALVESGEVGVPLSTVDEQDPQLADRVRAQLGWPLRHAGH
jgi:hypothetical protein